MREEGAASFERARGHSAQPRWRFCPPSPGLPGQQVHVFGIPLNSRHPWETKYPRSFSRDVSFLLKTFLECRLLQPCHPDARPPGTFLTAASLHADLQARPAHGIRFLTFPGRSYIEGDLRSGLRLSESCLAFQRPHRGFSGPFQATGPLPFVTFLHVWPAALALLFRGCEVDLQVCVHVPTWTVSSVATARTL